MSVEQQVEALTASVNNLKAAVVSKKATLDASVADAQSATAQAQAAKVNALSARDQAGAFKHAAYSAAQSAASVVAYQDLTALAQTKAVNAVDVFIYDTSKDSDGGAWRHRCAGTSWFSEPLNTAIRGARRGFPAVAILVLESNKLTIYDGDNPGLPMWRVYLRASFSTLGQRDWYGVTALNGLILIHKDGDINFAGIGAIDFVGDRAQDVRRGPVYDMEQRLSIKGAAFTASADWMSGAGFLKGPSSVQVNDLAMTVLSDAPTDPATGLPVPTIAAATAGGISVIRDGGTIANVVNYITPPPTVAFVTIGGVPRIMASSRYSNWVFVVNIPSGNINSGAYFDGLNINGAAFITRIADGDDVLHLGTNRGLKLYAKNQVIVNAPTTPNVLPMQVVIRSHATSGWLLRGTLGSWLSSTDDTDFVGGTDVSASGSGTSLVVHGTITRAPVETGAELMAYGGLTEQNYLEAEHETFLDTLYAIGWEQHATGRWEFKHGLVNTAPIDGLTITGNTLKIAGTRPKALIRLSTTSPSATQLAKIAQDERMLFQPNAACTFHGTSDAVSRLAYDPETGLLHIGTNQARSVFRGLQRVTYVPQPANSALAVSGGMVAQR